MVFIEDRNVISDVGRIVDPTPGMTSRVENTIADNNWYASDLLRKPVRVSTGTWNTQSRGHDVLSFQIPQIFNTANTLYNQILKQFNYFRWDKAIIRIQLNATRFHAGILAGWWDPFNQTTPITQPIADGEFVRRVSIPYITGMPHVRLNASQSTVAELEIPWESPLQWISTANNDDYDNLGAFHLSVVNPLSFATGTSPAVNVTVYLYFENPTLHVPSLNHNLVFTEASGIVDSLSTAFNAGSNVMNNIKTGNFAAAIGKGAEGVAKLFGFDKPIAGVQTESSIHPVQPLCHGSGIDHCIRLSLVPTSASVPALEDVGSTDEMEFNKIISVPMILYQQNWTTSQTSGTLIKSLPITPQVMASDANQFNGYPTYSTWISAVHSQWAGSLEYQFEFAATSFHSGKLLICFDPNTNTALTPTLDYALSLPNITLDIQEAKIFKFNVPFYSTTKWKMLYNLSQSNFAAANNLFTGLLRVYILNELVASDNIAQSIEYNVYVNCGPDMQFAIPAHSLASFYTFAPAITSSIVTEASGVVDNNTRSSSDVDMQSLGVGSTLNPPSNVAGEVSKFKDIMKRYTGYNGDPTTVLTAQNLETYVSPVLQKFPTAFPLTSANSSITTSLLGYLGCIFASWTGSIRYMAVFMAPRNSGRGVTVYHYPYTYTLTTDSYFAGLVTTLSQQNGISYETPFVTQHNIKLTLPDLTAPINTVTQPLDVGFTSLYQTNRDVDANVVSSQFYTSAGDDFIYHNLVSPPTVSVIDIVSDEIKKFTLIETL